MKINYSEFRFDLSPLAQKYSNLGEIRRSIYPEIKFCFSAPAKMSQCNNKKPNETTRKMRFFPREKLNIWKWHSLEQNWWEEDKRNSAHVCLNDMFTVSVMFTRNNTNEQIRCFYLKFSGRMNCRIFQLEFAWFDRFCLLRLERILLGVCMSLITRKFPFSLEFHIHHRRMNRESHFINFSSLLSVEKNWIYIRRAYFSTLSCCQSNATCWNFIWISCAWNTAPAHTRACSEKWRWYDAAGSAFWEAFPMNSIYFHVC